MLHISSKVPGTPIPFLLPLILIPLLNNVPKVEANFEDNRCRCICPSTEYFNTNALHAGNSTEHEDKEKSGLGAKSRRYYTKTNIDPLSCNTQTVVKKAARSLVDEQRLDAFLANCQCKFESRNSLLLKVVVVFVICVLFGLSSYMAYLTVVNPMLRQREQQQGFAGAYRRQEDDVGDGFSNNTFWFYNTSWGGPTSNHRYRRLHRPTASWSSSHSSSEEDGELEMELENNEHTTEENIFARSISSASLPQTPPVLASGSGEELEGSETPGQASSNGGQGQQRGKLFISPSGHIKSRGGILPLPKNVLDKVEEGQARWMSEVEQQRRKVMTEHSMLN